MKYQGYTIQSAPQYITNWEQWQLRIVISVDDHRGIRAREFSSAVLYKTEQEADISMGSPLANASLTGRSKVGP